VHHSTVLHFTALFCSAFIIIYVLYVTPFLANELRPQRHSYITQDSLRNSHETMHAYRSFQVLHANTMCYCGMFLAILNAILMLSSIYSYFTLIGYWKTLHRFSKAQIFIWGILGNGLWLCFLEIGLHLQTFSSRTIESWGRHNWGGENRNKIMSKFQKASKPIVFGWGKQSVIRKASLFIFQKGITRGTVRLLLTYRKS